MFFISSSIFLISADDERNEPEYAEDTFPNNKKDAFKIFII